MKKLIAISLCILLLLLFISESILSTPFQLSNGTKIVKNGKKKGDPLPMPPAPPPPPPPEFT